MEKKIAERFEFDNSIKEVIASPVQLEPEVDFALLFDPVTGWSISLGVRGYVKFDNGKECYSSWSEFPESLKKAVREGDDGVVFDYTSEGGMPWFEAFVYDEDDEFVDSAVCDDDILAHGDSHVKKALSEILLGMMERFGKVSA